MGAFKRLLTSAQESRHEEARMAGDGLVRDAEWDVEIIHPAKTPRPGLPKPVVFRTTEGERA